MEAWTLTPLDNNPLYSEGVHMLDSLVGNDMKSFLDEHPTIVLLFKIDVLSIVEPDVANAIEYEASHEPDPTSIKELQLARDTLERELAISQRVKASTLEDVNLGSPSEPHTVKIAKDLVPSDISALIDLLTEYYDVFAWSYNDMKASIHNIINTNTPPNGRTTNSTTTLPYESQLCRRG